MSDQLSIALPSHTVPAKERELHERYSHRGLPGFRSSVPSTRLDFQPGG